MTTQTKLPAKYAATQRVRVVLASGTYCGIVSWLSTKIKDSIESQWYGVVLDDGGIVSVPEESVSPLIRFQELFP